MEKEKFLAVSFASNKGKDVVNDNVFYSIQYNKIQYNDTRVSLPLSLSHSLSLLCVCVFVCSPFMF